MPLLDWSRADTARFQDLHISWLPEFQRILNSGLLPEGDYTLLELHPPRTKQEV
jgi:hypothetical protein